MNVAFFGGTFDPVHRGHLSVARAVLADPRFGIERLYFVPADIPPHKQNVHITPFKHRAAMLQEAVAYEPQMAVSEIEERVPGDLQPNYSVDTVRRFKQTLSPDDALFFVVGMDSLLQLSTWKDPVALLNECPFIVVSRPGYYKRDALRSLPESAPRENIHFLDTVAEDISATEIREAVAQQDPLEELVGPEVAMYIREHRLYQ